MRAALRLLTVCTAGVAMLAMAIPAANAGYPFKCPSNTVLVLQHDDPTATPAPFTGATAIQDAIDAADGMPAADTDADNPEPTSTAGDTVIICSGTYFENVSVPLTDSNVNSNITIRSFDDGSNPTIVGAAGSPVFDITAPGVLLGGTHLGFEITGESSIGIQVGVPGAVDLSEDDDQEQSECPVDPTQDCPDEELPPFATSNVAVVGNEIRDLGNGTDSVTGISINNTNNTLLFRNKVDSLAAGAGALATGIRYSDTNYNNDVISNAVKDLTQTGGSCGASSLEVPTVGAIGVSIQDEALDALVHRTLVDDIESSCSGIGVYSNAWGGLENTRNGQQVPIVTDILDNKIKHTRGATGNAAAIALAPLNPANTDDDGDPENPNDQNDPKNAPSSFRVLANDMDDHNGIGVAVLTGMAANSWIRENDLDSDKVGVLNSSGFNVDATNNWWGCDEGPASGKSSCATIVNLVNGASGDPSTTSYTPWLKHHAAHAGAHAGEYAGH